jgi:CheY-like chemotaxis protein
MLPRVLIVDESPESRDVLRTLLERHGATTIEAPRPEQALALADQFRPHLILLDAESDHSASGAATNDLCVAATRLDTPIVILGTVRGSCGAERTPPTSQFVSKPYHYGQLIRKIESLLAAA